MRSLVFDAGPVISITMNHLLGIFGALKKSYDGKFLITPTVKQELVDRPLEIKNFMFEALQALRCINAGILEVVQNEDIHALALNLETWANNLFAAHGNPIKIVHIAEMETLAAVILLKSDAIVVDERTARLLIEKPDRLRFILEHKLHTGITVNEGNLKAFSEATKGIKCIRSVELLLIAYEKGLLNHYLPNLPEPKRVLLNAVLWGLKLDGCAVSRKEIERIISMEARRR